MAQKTLILGASGCGKSTAIQNLDPKSTFIIQCTPKQLPFRGSGASYNKEHKNIYTVSNQKTKNNKGEEMAPDLNSRIIAALTKINENKSIKTIVIDDFNYIMTYGYKNKAKEVGYSKFEVLAFGIMDIFTTIDNMRPDLNVYVIAHIQKDNDGKVSMKTIGRFLDEKVCIEALFSIVILALGADNNYQFTVNGIDPAKSPVGMFETNDIPNDIEVINNAIKQYF